MNSDEVREEGGAVNSALTLDLDEPAAPKKVVCRRTTKKAAEGTEGAEGAAEDASAAEGSGEAAPVRKTRARSTTAKTTRTTRAKSASDAEAGEDGSPAAAAPAAPSEAAASAKPATSSFAQASAPATEAPAPAQPVAAAAPVAPAPAAPAAAPAPATPAASGPQQAGENPPPPRPLVSPRPASFGPAAIADRMAAAQNTEGQPAGPYVYQPRGRYAPTSEGGATPPPSFGPRPSTQSFRSTYGAAPIAPGDTAPAEAGAPVDAPEGTSAPVNPQNLAPNAPIVGGEPLDNADFQGDQRYGRDPLRFRGGRAQMRAERNMARGRHLRPGQPGYAPNGGPSDLPYNGGNGNNRGRREYDLLALEVMALPDLHKLAEELGVEVPPLKKDDLIHSILGKQAELLGNVLKKGILEILPDGKGFLRCSGYLPDDGDVYVSQSQIKRFNLKTGDTVTGTVRQPKEMERYHGLLRVEAINGFSPEVMKSRKEFEKLTPIFPTEKFQLETDQGNVTARIIDLVSPIGKGQRGLIVAPPKAGKTTLIKNVANSIMSNHPEVMLIVLLIDERPEEVTDISRSVRGEVVASTFDEMPENHMRVADMVLEKAKRWVELKHDVVILLDSITRLSRASNLVVTPSGRTLSGGLDPAAMYRPKRMFGAARNIEEGGSLTILATALVDTGSRMDEMIFEEFKGTGNMDLVLDRSLFDQRIFPAIDINKSGTRRDDLLMSREELAAVYHLRRTLSALDNDKAVTLLIDRLKNTKTNADFMQIVAKSRQQAASAQ